jgi:hypothetical protein
MSTNWIACVKYEAVQYPTTAHKHITHVGTKKGKSPHVKHLWTVQEVIKQMDKGDTFYTVNDASKTRRLVSKCECPHCPGHITLRSDPDVQVDSDLDNLPQCCTELKDAQGLFTLALPFPN